VNIAHLLPYVATFPLAKHNGRYEWALRLARLQVKQGHTVTVYAGPGSHDTTEPNIIWRSIPTSLGDKALNNLALMKKALANQEHTIYHSHFDHLHYEVAGNTAKPIVFTQHWFPNSTVAEASSHSKNENVFAVPVTDYMLAMNRTLGIRSVDRIYHGIDLDTFTPSGTPKSNRFIFVGRIAPHKGVREVITLAKKAGVALDIIGKINTSDEAYWNTCLPDVDGEQIRYIGALPQEKVATALASAKAFLFSSQALEAFGQVTIEAQACGTPVVINDIGASSELVVNGKTGFVVSTDTEFIHAIGQIDSINPEDCRAYAEKFDVHAMAQQYEDLYKSLI
jgi:glycosyltransferase involved in cell wall biosynthesis